MNNDYLWDRSGDDAEIEQFENLLHGYRYVETEPPELPAMNIISVRSTGRSRFGWVLAAATAAAVFGMTALYLQTARTPQNSVPENVAASLPTSSETPSTIDHQADRVDTAIMAASPDAKKALKPVQPRFVARPAITHRRIASPKDHAITEEELYAYNQVRLALFITSSKLQTINDVIDKIENKQEGSPKVK